MTPREFISEQNRTAVSSTTRFCHRWTLTFHGSSSLARSRREKRQQEREDFKSINEMKYHRALNYLNSHFLVVHEQRLVRKYLEEEHDRETDLRLYEKEIRFSSRVPRLVKYNRQIIRFLSFSCSSWRFVPDCFVEGLNRRKPYQSSIKLRGGFVQSSTTVPFHLI